MEPMHYGAGKHRPRHHRHLHSPSLSRYGDWELQGDIVPNSLPYHTRRHEVQRPDDGGILQSSSHRHRRASEDPHIDDSMPPPSRRVNRSVTVTDQSSASRRPYDDDDDDGDDEDDRLRARLRSRSSLNSTSLRTSRHSQSVTPETPPRRARRSRSTPPSRGTSRTSRSSSVDSASSLATQDERKPYRAAKKQTEVITEPEPGPSERRRQQHIDIYVDDSDHVGIYEEPEPIRARDDKSSTLPHHRRRSDSRSSSKKRNHRDRRDQGKHISLAKKYVSTYCA